MSDHLWGHPHRFFVEPTAIEGSTVRFDHDQSHQLTRVLRIGSSEAVIVLTGDGLEHLVRIVDTRPKACLGSIADSRDSADRPTLAVTLCQALLPRERFEQALAKATEVGIARFVPLRTQRTVAKIDDRDWPSRLTRLTAIAREASEQSERSRLPEIGAPLGLPEAIDRASMAGPALLAWERRQASIGRDVLRSAANDPRHAVSIIIGPEGGFTEEEIALATARGAALVWLGPRILRSETAGPVLTALLLHESGDMGLAP